MNNKYIKYFLIVAVVGVWSTIIYRIVHGASGPADPAPVVKMPARAVNPVDDDTFHLYADYPDPFLPESDSIVTDTAIRKTVGTSTAAITPAIPSLPHEVLSTIVRYQGTITNPKNKSRIAIVTIRGKEYLARENDKIEDIRIKKIEKNRISVVYKGEVSFIGP